MNVYFFLAAILAALAFTIYQLSTLGKALMSTQEAVDKLTAQVVKIQGEVVAAKDVLLAQVVSLQDQLAAAGVAEQVDLTGLTNAVQSLDDINPDEEDEPEVPVEQPVVDPIPEPVE